MQDAGSPSYSPFMGTCGECAVQKFLCSCRDPEGPSMPRHSEAAPVLLLWQGPREVQARPLCDLRDAQGGAGGGWGPGDPWHQGTA